MMECIQAVQRHRIVRPSQARTLRTVVLLIRPTSCFSVRAGNGKAQRLPPMPLRGASVLARQQ